MRYGTLTTLEEGYGINLLPLATFAMDTWQRPMHGVCVEAEICRQNLSGKDVAPHCADAQGDSRRLSSQTGGGHHKAPSGIWMDGRLLLDKIDFKRGMLCYGGKEYKMLDSEFPTIDPNDPYRLTAEECDLVEKCNSFTTAATQAYPLFHDRGKHVSCVQQQSAFPCLDSVECRRLVQGGDNPR